MRVLRYMGALRKLVHAGWRLLGVQGQDMVRKSAASKLTGNAGIWRDRGLTEQGGKYADEAMPLMLAALKAARVTDGDAIAKAVFAEALWQLTQLSKLDEDVRERVLWKHP